MSERVSAHSWSGLALTGLATSVVMLLAVWPTADLSLGGDHYIHLARRFASGFINVDDLAPKYRDYVAWNGHKYLPFGPVPAALLAPFIFLGGAGIPLVFYGYAVGILNVLIFQRVLKRMSVTGERNRWMVLLYFGGTVYLSVTLAGISTFFAHIVTTLFLLLAILESLGRRRFLLVGLCIGLAAGSRMTAAFSLPFFVYLAWRGKSSSKTDKARDMLASLALLAAGLAVPMMLLAAYNHARFGDPAETGFGLALLYSQVLQDARSNGLFSLAHVPKNLFMMLLQGPVAAGGEGSAVLRFPYITPSPWGMSLFLTTPALVYAFRASLKDHVVRASWLAIALTLIPIVTYYGIGYVQFGYRYSLDFMPFLMLLVARGLPPVMTRASMALIAASVIINIWGAITLSVWI
jgi:hypothetical protein